MAALDIEGKTMFDNAFGEPSETSREQIGFAKDQHQARAQLSQEFSDSPGQSDQDHAKQTGRGESKRARDPYFTPHAPDSRATYGVDSVLVKDSNVGARSNERRATYGLDSGLAKDSNVGARSNERRARYCGDSGLAKDSNVGARSNERRATYGVDSGLAKDSNVSARSNERRATYGGDRHRARDPYYSSPWSENRTPYSTDASPQNSKGMKPAEQFLEDLHKLLDPNYRRNGFQTKGKF